MTILEFIKMQFLAGLVMMPGALLLAGISFGVYWLIEKRKRRKK